VMNVKNREVLEMAVSYKKPKKNTIHENEK